VSNVDVKGKFQEKKPKVVRWREKLKGLEGGISMGDSTG